jgi:hypothetical protein
MGTCRADGQLANNRPVAARPTVESTRCQLSVSPAWRIGLLVLILTAFFSMGHFAGAYQKEQNSLRTQLIQAEKFELRSADGRLEASLYTGSRNETYLSFFDSQKIARLTLGLDATGSPAIMFFNAKGLLKMGLSIGPDGGSPSINLFNDKAQSEITLGVLKGLGPELAVGKPETGRIAVGVSRNGLPSVTLSDRGNLLRMSLAITDDGPMIALMSDDGSVRAILRILPDGSPQLSFADQASRERLVVKTDKDGKPSIRLIDPDGNQSRELK